MKHIIDLKGKIPVTINKRETYIPCVFRVIINLEKEDTEYYREKFQKSFTNFDSVLREIATEKFNEKNVVWNHKAKENWINKVANNLVSFVYLGFGNLAKNYSVSFADLWKIIKTNRLPVINQLNHFYLKIHPSQVDILLNFLKDYASS